LAVVFINDAKELGENLAQFEKMTERQENWTDNAPSSDSSG